MLVSKCHSIRQGQSKHIAVSIPWWEGKKTEYSKIKLFSPYLKQLAAFILSTLKSTFKRKLDFDKRIFLFISLSTVFVPGITVLLSLTVFMLLVAEIMPATSDSVPLIGKTLVSTNYCTI